MLIWVASPLNMDVSLTGTISASTANAPTSFFWNPSRDFNVKINSISLPLLVRIGVSSLRPIPLSVFAVETDCGERGKDGVLFTKIQAWT